MYITDVKLATIFRLALRVNVGSKSIHHIQKSYTLLLIINLSFLLFFHLVVYLTGIASILSYCCRGCSCYFLLSYSFYSFTNSPLCVLVLFLVIYFHVLLFLLVSLFSNALPDKIYCIKRL